MKQLLYLSTALILFVGMISCDKDRNYTVIEGSVLEYGSLDPIENAAIEIYQIYSKGLFQGFVQWPIDTIYTNSSGRFKFRTDVDPHNDEYDSAGAFGIGQIWHDNYFPENSIYGEIAEAFHLAHLNEEIQLDPHAWLKVSVNDVQNVQSDYCKVWADYFNSITTPLGESKDLEVVKLPGNQEHNIYIKFFDNIDASINPVYFDAFDTLSYHIDY